MKIDSKLNLFLNGKLFRVSIRGTIRVWKLQKLESNQKSYQTQNRKIWAFRKFNFHAKIFMEIGIFSKKSTKGKQSNFGNGSHVAKGRHIIPIETKFIEWITNVAASNNPPNWSMLLTLFIRRRLIPAWEHVIGKFSVFSFHWKSNYILKIVNEMISDSQNRYQYCQKLTHPQWHIRANSEKNTLWTLSTHNDWNGDSTKTSNVDERSTARPRFSDIG